ncbi:acyltransferase family protein [Streptomyces sp. NPDC051569]|uniref:acyltransferase family protein n=1 Tax=Streptomyces sp. NPDC051569 TaxID=3365661 RepID=UPI0037B6FBF8
MFQAPYRHERAPLPRVREREPTTGTPPTGMADTPRQAGSGPAVSPVDQPARPPAPATRRDAFFDNAKYLAIVLVAVAHAWEPVADGSRATKALYLLVYSFHMPAFIIMSGYFSRSFAARPHQIRRLLTGVAVPYAVFETAYSLFRRYAGGAPDQPVSLLDPMYLTWFLAALFIWRLTAPVWRTLRHPPAVALVIASLASLAPGIGEDLNLQRVLQFLPYFVLGLCLRPEHFQLVRRREVRLLAAPLFAGALAFSYWAATHMRSAWLYHSAAAQQLDSPWWVGPVMTFALFGCSVLLTAGFLAWVPRRRTWFTVLGAGTICGYLLHGFLVKGAEYAGFLGTGSWLSEPAGEIALTLLTAVAVTLLCTPPVRRAFRWATEPEMAWAFRREAAGRETAGPAVAAVTDPLPAGSAAGGPSRISR